MSTDQDADRKETEEILSGFDRPGRTPRSPRVRDFVGFYSNPGMQAEPEPLPLTKRREETPPQEKRTVVIPRESRLRGTMMWALAVVGMILFGVTIAVLATPESPPAPAASTPPPVAVPTSNPSSATTITSAEPPSEGEPMEDETTTDTIITAPPPSAPASVSKKTAPAPAKTTPRDDFIRDM